MSSTSSPDVHYWADAGGRLRPRHGDAVRHYRETSDAGPLDEYDRAHRAQTQRLRRAARGLGLTFRQLGSECHNVCSIFNSDRVRVAFGSQDDIETWLLGRETSRQAPTHDDLQS